ARHLRRGALELVEVRRHRDDRALDGRAEGGLRDLPRALQDERADLGQRVVLAARVDERALSRALPQLEREPLPGLHDLGAAPRAADEALVAVDRVLRVDDASSLRRRPDEHLAVRVEADDAREQTDALLVCEYVHLPR